MNVKNWNFSYSVGGKKAVKQNILDTISLWVAIGLLWFSFISMLGEHFPTYLEQMDWWSISLYVLVLWLGYEWPKKYARNMSIFCQVLGIGIPVVYIVLQLERIADGLVSIANVYLPYINTYYKTLYELKLTGSPENEPLAFSAICMILWGLVWSLAYGWKKRILLVIFPILALTAELFVGLSPLGSGLLFAFFAAFLLGTLGSISIVRKVLALAFACGSVFLTGVLFDVDIQKLSTYESKQELIQWQNNLSLDSFNIFKLLQIDMHANVEQLNNNAPQYTGETVLEIECDKRPANTVYLKGFHATNYVDGNWIYDERAFAEACNEAGKSESEVAKEMFQSSYEKGMHMNSLMYDNMDSRLVSYKISYKGTTGDIAYVPYYSDYTSLDEDYTLKGDYLLKKPIFDNRIEVKAADVSDELLNWMYQGVSEENSFLNGFSKTYLQLPEETEYLQKIGNGIFYYLDGSLSVEPNFEPNFQRISHVLSVQQYLSSHMSYSLRLDIIPEDVDPVEYALTKSYEGYCMHFASAAALLLREAGVPVRYVSGYAVDLRSFILDRETGTYKANVGDYMAHAWIEVYLDDVGWVPVEVTPGGSLTSLPTDEAIRQWEKKSEANRQDRPEPEPETEDSETTEDIDTEPEPEDSQVQETEEDTSSESETQENTENKPSGEGGKTGAEFLWNIGNEIVIIGVITGLVLLSMYMLKCGILRYESALNKEIEENMTRRAVTRINRRLYRRLRLFKIDSWFGNKWNDLEYQSALAEQFKVVSVQEWEKYMEIVKKNHYSKDTISTEEMQYCYDCYKKVKERK